MRTVIITTPSFFTGEAEAICRFLASGDAWRVHLRKPGSGEEEMRRLIATIPHEFYGRLSLHDHHKLAAEYGLGGIHLKSRNPEAPDGWHGLVSKSIHSVEEIGSLTDVDYAFLSPIYPSISKPGYKADFSIEALSGHVGAKVFALGGVTTDKFAELEAAGFGGAAMLGAAWRPRIDRKAFAMQFITHDNGKIDTVEGARIVLEGGCRWVQLRMKDATRNELIAAGREIAALCRSYGATFIVDDHVELVHELGADGVHLGKNDMPVEEARRRLGPLKIIGSTANTFADIEHSARAGADYIGLGPFRFTQTKKNLSPVLGLDGYRRILAECREAGIDLPVVAIGGISDADIPAIMQTGVAGIALSSSILNAAAPVRQTEITLKSIQDSTIA